MLCPEVWKFSPPESNYKETSGQFQTVDGTYLPPPLKDFYYTHLVSVVLPNALTVPETITESLSSDCDYYKVENISLAELVSKEFVQHFIKNGSLTALSINRRIDIDNCACITPDGSLTLTLDRKSFQELGLDGKVSHFASNKKEKYIVRLNLKHDSFIANKKLYDRTRQCLTERLEKFTFIISWTPEEENICPSSVAKFLCDHGYSVSLCTPKSLTRSQSNVKIPQIRENNALFSGSELVEWLGMFSVDADLDSGSFDAYINTYEVPEEHVLTNQVQYIEWRGLFTVDQVQKLYQKLTDYITATSNNKTPWISMYVQGFSDSPVAWKLQEHHYYTNGDNAYVLFLQPSGKYLLCTRSCTNKKHK